MRTVDNTPHCHHSLSSKNLFFLYHLLVLLSFNSLSLKASLASTNGLYTDSQQLLNFKASLPNADSLQNWVPNNTPCNFTGVSCRNSIVSSVNLSYTHLGIDFLSVVRFLITLPNLETLLLKSTNLTGSVSPVAESQCGAVLSSVDLSDNGLSSSVSELSSFAACSNLKSLNISTNSFHFTIGSKHSNGLRLNLQILDLSHNLISGENIVPMLFSGGCGDLRYLSLKGNKIAGAVPLSDCQTLKYLDLSDNNISSTFPSLGDCLFLEHLDLSSNKFSGDISTGLSGCERLNFLNLTKNQFSGDIPVLPGGGKLQFVYLSGNHFTGEIPLHLTRLCSSLIELDISSNNLSGTVPDTFGVCSSLESFDISNNKFSGSLPIQTLLNLTNLKTMVLSFNNFVGGLPNSLMKLTNLETLDMSSNSLNGSIPLGLCNDPRNSLKELYLQNNMFSGPVPDSLSNCSQLVSLDLSFNNLTGTIPTSLGSLSRLRDLIIWLNQLHGEIPKELMYIQTLENLILDFNELTGTIPAGLSNCTNLNWISLSNNRLSGEIPASLGRLANLAILKLGNNSISGSIPAELGDCRSLLWLDLNTNLLSGTIPPALFKQSGHIAVAALTGKRYKYIKNDGSKQCHGAGNLIEFGGIRQEQMNRISTRHPCNFTRVYDPQPTFIHNGSMIFLDLSYNMLNGSIPKELGSVYYLLILNLGHNDLSGPLPQELGGLKNVAILDLSYNRLNGSIPQSLTGLTSLGEIHLSNNNLSGMIPQSTQFNTLPDYEFLNNSGLCGWPLPSCGADSSSSWNSQYQKSHRRQASHAVSLSVVLLFALFCLVGLIIVFIETNKRRKRKDAAGLGIYMDGNSHSGTGNTNWKLTSAREALSINLATFEKPLRRLTFADLVEATNGFHDDSRVGSGGFGDVYKAQLKDGSVVAIKKLIHISGQGDREFTNEMKTIGKIKHRNLVPLVGYCKVGEERLLVYEYMKYGSLDNVLHERENGIGLNWAARRKIAIGAARGLTFLHHTCIPHIIHRDMKSSNVLVDQNLEARVSDFGMARLMSAMDTHLSVSTLAGTPGYVPPEYFQSFKCSTQGDVYSYGVILLELLTGKKPTQSPDFGDNNLVGWVKQHSKMRMRDVFDRELLDEDPILEIELLQYLKVANACLDDWPLKRPTMIQVMAMFKEIQAGSGIPAAAATTDDESFNNVGGGVEMSIEEGNEYVEQANT